jgi:hypothetical protein
MEPIVSMIQGTGQEFARFVQVEAKRWTRYAKLRVGTLEKSARQLSLSPVGLERRVLVGVDGTLRAIDARVRIRLAALDKKATKKLGAGRGRSAAARRKSSAAKPNGSQSLGASH